jgi:hypothetical protein
MKLIIQVNSFFLAKMRSHDRDPHWRTSLHLDEVKLEVTA